ncbi:unnamed protein product [Leptidea sinapis]|uniref:Orcokinin n=1 Tax=Leptidea sinapis TaxID=189913 RepID=A0A5E4Q1T5_9NEOP|nr:unnamed protein product [Leptidea sinapis]
MIRLSSALAVAIATILVCCNAESRQERDVSPDRLNDAAFRQKQEVDNFIRLLVQNELMNGGRHFSRIGGTNGRQRSFVYGLTADKLGDNLDRTAPYGELNGVEDEKMQYARFIDSLGGLKQQSLARQSREAHRISRNFGRHYEYLSPFGTRSLAPFEYGYYGEGLPKRNFDEIDRSNLDTFVKKRNFDEIDQSSMPFPYKRYINYVDSPYDNSIRQGGMDEIDLSSFPLNVIGMPPRRGH